MQITLLGCIIVPNNVLACSHLPPKNLPNLADFPAKFLLFMQFFGKRGNSLIRNTRLPQLQQEFAKNC